MADYAALLNAEKKKTSPSPTKDVQQVQNPHMQNTGKPENLPVRDDDSQKEKTTTPTPSLLQTQPQKTNERTNERFIVSTLHRKNDCSFHLPNVSPNALSIV